MAFTLAGLKGLSNLLDEGEKEEVLEQKVHSLVDEIDHGTTKVNRPKTQPAQKKKPRVKDPKDIWDIDEVSDDELNNDDDDFDDRIQPEFEIMYKQSVSAEDKYMNMGMKDCSSNFCDGIVIKIEFPNTAYSEISLDVTKTRLVAQSIKYKLFLNLPHNVNEAKGKAQWEHKSSTLKVTLPIVREWDE